MIRGLYLTQRGGWPGRTDWRRSPSSSFPTAELTGKKEMVSFKLSNFHGMCLFLGSTRCIKSNYNWCGISGNLWQAGLVGHLGLIWCQVSGCYQQYKCYNISVTGLTLSTWQEHIFPIGKLIILFRENKVRTPPHIPTTSPLVPPFHPLPSPCPFSPKFPWQGQLKEDPPAANKSHQYIDWGHNCTM